MRTRPCGIRGGIALLLGLVVVYPFVSGETVRGFWYDAVGALSVGHAWLGVRHHRAAHPRAWLLVIGGFLGWVLGDVVSTLETSTWHLAFYPVPSDAVYLMSYVTLGAGLLALVRGKRTRRDLSVVLDAAIISTGTAVLVGVFVVAPIAADSTLSLLGKLVSSAYPLADVAMIGILVRLWVTPGARSSACRLLTSALAVTLLADVVWNTAVVSSGVSTSSVWNDVAWLLGYVLLAAACWSPSIRDVAPPRAPRSERPNTRAHLGALTAGLLLPAVALLLNGWAGIDIQWQIIGTGSILLSVLALARAAGLLRTVQTQAVQLAALARSDGLTGAPNRRTWDFELSRACQVARETGDLLCVALIDLDNFKRYNDTHGHQAGDLLLREAVAIWSETLRDGDMLARYGGEEFAVLMPGRTMTDARTALDVLRRATPARQTFSAGVAVWDPATDPSSVVAAADAAMYDAKRSGRNRVCLADGAAPHERVPTPTIVLQPIVDLGTGAVVAMEALSRFGAESPHDVFERAHLAGVGAELEAAAIRAALLCRPSGVILSVNVSLTSLTHPHVVAALPTDLTGITLEITEHTDTPFDVRLEACLRDLRRRGALLAVDDWGRGFSNLDRLLRLRPEVVKLDITLVHGLGSDYHRATVRSVVAWANEVGVRVCAEGVETEQQRRTLLDLGVHTAQGYLFGAPADPGRYAASGLVVG
jgi:diguanylate cyclase (GGDEF)-like protein